MHVFGMLIIGDEILSGRRQDKHLQRAIEILAARQQRLGWARFVGDDSVALTSTVRDIRRSDHICFTFGGIGATPDDLTRQCVATACETPLVRHLQAQAEIEARFGAQAHPHRVLMADLPEGAGLIPNPVNRVPGFSIERFHCLPGFPEMAWPMMEWVLDTLYSDRPPTRPSEASVVVHNARESELLSWMNDFVARHPDLKLFSLPRFLQAGETEIELGIAGPPGPVQAGLTEIRNMLESRGYRYRNPP